jgi:hypothetical protein
MRILALLILLSGCAATELADSRPSCDDVTIGHAERHARECVIGLSFRP